MEREIVVSQHLYHEHVEYLGLLCRVCGERCDKRTKDRGPKLCINYVSEIAGVYNIDIRHDSLDQHPDKLCLKCYKRLMNAKACKGVLTSFIPLNEKQLLSNINTRWTRWNETVGTSRRLLELLPFYFTGKGWEAKKTSVVECFSCGVFQSRIKNTLLYHFLKWIWWFRVGTSSMRKPQEKKVGP